MAFEELQRLARAVEQGWAAAWASLGAVATEPRTIVEDTPEFLRVYTPDLDESLLNLVMRYAAPGPVTPDDIVRMLAPYRAHRLVPQWWLLRGDEPEGLRDQLRTAGMRSWGGSTAMAASLASILGDDRRYPPPPSGADLGLASTPEEARDALAVISNVFYITPDPLRRWSLDNPAFRIYAARWQGRVVAALETMQTGEAVGVYNVATLAGARRRGLAGNLVLLALREAHADGCTLATLTATPEARPLYEQLGFRACGVIEQWMPGHRLTLELIGHDGEQDPWY
jgi:GNAT superfamily N-acetyltransferase